MPLRPADDKDIIEIDEVITLVEDNLPDGLHLLADSGGMLTRASETTFEALSAGATRVVVRNTFSGEHLPYLVESDLHGYTQSFLETFRDFAQGRGAP